MYKKLIKLTCAAAVATACSSAGAATTDLLSIPAGTNKTFSGAVLGGPLISFGDFFIFDMPTNGGSAYSVINFPVQALGLDLAFASLALFYTGSDHQLGGPVTDTLVKKADGLINTGSPSLSFNVGVQPAGKYYLFVSGFTTGSGGGLYSGSVSVFPVPVPEPETWAMMLIGAGLVGFRLRTRSKKAAAHRFV